VTTERLDEIAKNEKDRKNIEKYITLHVKKIEDVEDIHVNKLFRETSYFDGITIREPFSKYEVTFKETQ